MHPLCAVMGKPSPEPSPVHVPDLSTSDSRVASTAIASFTLNTDGSCANSPSTAPGNWYSPTTTSIGDNYWARVTVTSGSLFSGTVDSWLQLNTFRAWTRQNGGIDGTLSATITLEIASDSGGSTIVASRSGIVLSATYASA